MQLLHLPRTYKLRPIAHLMRRQIRPLPPVEEEFLYKRAHGNDICFRARHYERIPPAHHAAGKHLLHRH